MSPIILWFMFFIIVGCLWLAAVIGSVFKDKPRVEETGISTRILFNGSEFTVFNHSGVVLATGNAEDIKRCIKVAEERNLI